MQVIRGELKNLGLKIWILREMNTSNHFYMEIGCIVDT